MDKSFSLPDSSVDLYSDIWTEADRALALKLQGPIWVIGASGFIGAKLFYSLARLRPDVYAISREVEASWRLLNCPFKNRIRLDITKGDEVRAAVQRWRPRTVFNLSAYGAYERQNEASQIHGVNYIGTLNLITSLLEAGCDALVQAGSSSEYGLNCAGPQEDAALEPNSDYAVSKAAAGYLIRYYGKFKGFPGVNLRLYSIYGPWEERDRLIPTLIRNGLRGVYPSFVDKNITRDFVYVDDCTRAFVLAALNSCQQTPGACFNIGSGIKTSLQDVATIARGVFSIADEPVFGSMSNRKWDLSNWYSDPHAANERLGWRHRVSFKEGLELTVNWEKSVSGLIKFGVRPEKIDKISAIIACYRDEPAIPHMYERLTNVFLGLGVDYEIIFVNDRSPSGDEQVIRSLCEKDPRVIGISHSRNFGSQCAFCSGMEIASGDAVVLLDGDLQDTPETITSFYEKWKSGFDVVYGVRVKREAALYMQFLYKAFYRVFKHLSDVDIPLDAGDFSLIDRKVVNRLLEFKERDLFLRGLRAWVGFRQIGVPYVRPERMFGRTTNSFLKNIWWAKKAIFSFSVKPLNYIQSLGLAICVLSLGLTLYYFVNYLLRPPTGAPGVTTIILLVLGLGGMQLFALSILGDYLGKVLEEAKQRPRFVRSAIFSGGDVFTDSDGMTEFRNRRKRLT